MSLLNRRSGRRVVGVILGASLLVLGLEAPAFAAPPAISSLTPTSGPAAGGCVVVVTGTALDDFPAAANYVVEFVSTNAAVTTIDTAAATDYAIISDTELWAVAPALDTGAEYNIRITNPGGTNTSTTAFLATVGAGGCAPTVASFAPTCGPAGTAVVITGTNLLMDVTATGGFTGSIGGGLVSFSPYTSDAGHTVPNVDTATSLSVVVPSDAADGPIKVTTKGTTVAPTSGMSVFSTQRFEVPPPDCVTEPPPGDTHERNVRLRLRAHLIGKGKVTVPDGTTECAQNVPVKIQRKRSGGWRTVKATTTSATGSFKKRLPDRPGVYRAVARKITLPDTGDVCLKDVSNRVRHRH